MENLTSQSSPASQEAMSITGQVHRTLESLSKGTRDMQAAVNRKVVFDLDGTLLDLSGIRDWALGKRDDYEEFHRLASEAPVNEYVTATLKALWDTGWEIFILTARSSVYYNETCKWLATNSIPFHHLSMRPSDNTADDVSVKKSMLLNKVVPWGRYTYPHLAFDDNPKIIKLYQDYGIPTVQVPGWDWE